MSIGRAGPQRRSLSQLLLAGLNPLANPVPAAHALLSPLPFSSWLGSVGRAEDVLHGWRLSPSALSSGNQHSLIGYTSLGVDRVFGVGRNEVAQLGVGFASQEGTRGLVEGFEGEEVLASAASNQSSYLLVRDQQSHALYTFGSLSRGRLSHPLLCPPPPLEPGEEPSQMMLAQATRVTLPEGMGRIVQMEVGFEHLIVLTEDGTVWGTGCNTDGQLGLGPEQLDDVFELTEMPLPEEVKREGVASVRAGADTSSLLTKSGKLWTWGNSEYGQALHGKKIDQILSPLAIDHAFLPSARRVKDYRCGGSFGIVLDDAGDVYAAGYGALARGADSVSSLEVKRIAGLEGIDRIRAAWGYAAAIRDAFEAPALYTWGLNNPHGRLGHGLPRTRAGLTPPPPTPAYEPREVELPIKALGMEGEWKLGQVELGRDQMWVEVVEERVE